MQALVFDKSKFDWASSKGFEKVDVPEPVLGAGDEDKIIIKVQYAGVCGTDRGIWNRQAFRDQILNSIDQEIARSTARLPAPEGAAYGGQADEAISSKKESASPLAASGLAVSGKKTYRIIGHEFFGEVVGIGSAVENVKVGDMVSCESHVVCNECYQCLHGQKYVCVNERILGISMDGGFAEYVKVPAHVAWKTDTSKIRPEIAVMQEPFGNAVHAASKVDLHGKTVAIFGLGPIGSFLTLIAKGTGAAKVIGIEPNEKALEMGKALGADHLIKIQPAKDYRRDPQIIDRILELTGGVGADVAFEMSGYNDSVNNAIASVRRGGEVVLFGLKTGDFVFEDFNRLVMKGVTMHCVAGRQIWQTWETTRKLLEDKSNCIQDKLWNIILQEGQGTILDFKDYTPEKFEKMMLENPKILFRF